VRVDAAQVIAGASVRVTATVGELDKKVQGARIELGYKNTYRKDSTDSEGDTTTITSSSEVIVATQQIPVADGQSPGEVVAELQVPADAPGSAPGVIEWFARATVDRRRAPDAAAKQPVTVLAPVDALRTWSESPPAVDGNCTFALDASTRTVQPGDRITGTLKVTAQDEISARGVRVQLERRRYDPDRNVDADDKTRVELYSAGELRPGEEHVLPFEIAVPSDAPPSFQAQHNHQRWYLQGVVDVKRSSDPNVSLEIVVHTA